MRRFRRLAAMLALREHISKYADPKEADKHVEELRIQMGHFEEAMKKIRPLSTQELKYVQENIRTVWKARNRNKRTG